MINRLTFALLLSLLLVSCEKSPQAPASDGYKFGEKEYEKTKLEVELVIIEDQATFDRTAKQYVSRLDEIQAFSRLFPSENKCIIYIKDPEWTYQPEYIGHELAHCVWGRWH